MSRTSTPWHLWVIGVLALIWNAFGALDFVMSQVGSEAYLAQFTPEQKAFLESFPLWVIFTWALGVAGGVFGSMLLLLRKGWAIHFLIGSVVGMVLTSLHNYILSDGIDVMGGIGPAVFSAVIFIVALLLIAYARSMRTKGVLD